MKQWLWNLIATLAALIAGGIAITVTAIEYSRNPGSVNWGMGLYVSATFTCVALLFGLIMTELSFRDDRDQQRAIAAAEFRNNMTDPELQ